MAARASLGTLPPELKAKIVAMAFDQQESWKKRDPQAFEKAFKPHTRATRDRWHALSLVNWEFRHLAADHIFRELDYRSVDNPTLAAESTPAFHLLIKPNHAARMKVIVLGTDKKTCDGPLTAFTFYMLDSFPNLSHVAVGGECAEKLFGSWDSHSIKLTINQTTNITLFLRVGRRLTCLDLHELDPTLAAKLVRACPGLVNLKIRDTLWSGHYKECVEDFVPELFDALSTLTQLTTFDFGLDGCAAWWNPPEDWQAPAVKHLRLKGIYYPHDLLKFIEHFSRTLTSLSLSSLTYDEATETDVEAVCLPRLSSLSLHTGTEDDSEFEEVHEEQLFPHFYQSPLLSFEYHNPLIDMSLAPTSPLQQFLARQPLIRRLDLSTECKSEDIIERGSARDIAAFSTIIHSRGLDTAVVEDESRSPFTPGANLDFSADELEHPAGCLERTLKYGLNEVARMVREGNVATLGRWVGVLGQLEAERRKWAD